MVHECDRRRTDHATEKCVAIGEVACTRAISPDNNNNKKKKYNLATTSKAKNNITTYIHVPNQNTNK